MEVEPIKEELLDYDDADDQAADNDDDDDDDDYTVQQDASFRCDSEDDDDDDPEFATRRTPRRSARKRPRRAARKSTSAEVTCGEVPAKKSRGARKRSTPPKKPRKARKKAPPPPEVQCSCCEKKLKMNSLLTMHCRIKHNQRTYFQELRRKSRSFNLSSHVRVQKEATEGQEAFGCKRCGRGFERWSQWVRHYNRKHVNTRRCVRCKATFSSPLLLLFHQHRKHRARLVLKRR